MDECDLAGCTNTTEKGCWIVVSIPGLPDQKLRICAKHKRVVSPSEVEVSVEA